MAAAFSRAVSSVIGIVSTSLLSAGCPKKITDRVIETVQAPCVPNGPVAAPSPSIDALTVAAILTTPEGRKAVVVAPGYAALVGEKDAIGAEGGTVTNVLGDGITLQTRDGKSRRLAVSTELGAAPSPEVGPDSVAPAPTDQGGNPELDLWREAVLGGINKGFGVPYEALLTVALAVTGSESPDVLTAQRGLEWATDVSLAAVSLERISVRRGRLLLEGSVPSEALASALKTRLESSNPVIQGVRAAPVPPRTDGRVGFSFTVETPLLAADDIARAGAADGPVVKSAQFEPHIGDIAPNSALGGFDDEARAAGTRAGFKTFEVTKSAGTVEEGLLGYASFDVTATGGFGTVVDFLRTVKQPMGKIGGRPVVVDPLEVTGEQVQMTVLVPYVVGKADSRSPAPPAKILPKLLNQRWSAAVAVPTTQLRDPFKK